MTQHNEPFDTPAPSDTFAPPPSAPPAEPSAMRPPSRRPDPGGPVAASLAWMFCLVLIPGVIVLQQCDLDPSSKAKAPAPAVEATSAPQLDQYSIAGRVCIKLYHSWSAASGSGNDRTMAQMFQAQLDQTADPSKSPLGPQDVDPREIRLNKLRAVISAGELLGPDDALKALEALEAEPPPPAPGTTPSDSAPADQSAAPAPADVPSSTDSAPPPQAAEWLDITPDIAPLKLIYSGRAAELTAEQRTALVDRHNWWGRLALSRGLPDTDPERQSLLSGGGRILAAGVFFLIAAGFAIVGGLAACVTMIVMLATGTIRRRFVPPAPGGSVYLEVLPVFVLAFLGVKVVNELWLKNNIGASLAVQWVLVLVPFWPLLRGVSFAEHRRLIGWHCGRGFFREIGAGIFAYFAGLPLLFLAAVMTFILMAIKIAVLKQLGKHAAPPENHVLDAFLKVDGWTLVLLVALATAWAPIVEEAVFRGSFFRHLRGRLNVFLCAAISAFVFGSMHGYDFLMLGPVMALGFTFAFMREWRGSLIAPMTAHALHNGTITILLALVLSAVRG